MSIWNNIANAAVKNASDSTMQLVASWQPSLVGQAQLMEWEVQAQHVAEDAAHAETQKQNAKARYDTIKANVERYAAAAAKLETINPEAANKAADQALLLKKDLESAKSQLDEATQWADETRGYAETAQQKIIDGKQKIENAKREQERAQQDVNMQVQRQHDREQAAGIINHTDGSDMVLAAMERNTRELREKANAAKIRSNALGGAVGADAAIQQALKEVDSGGPQPQTLAEKLAALKN